MSKEISITAVIPCFNSAETIERSIQSVFDQTEAVDELIVIDDGSSDQSVEIIERLFNKNNGSLSVKLIRQANSGPAAARNKGIFEAKSTYIAFLDGDDAWYPDKIKNEKKVLKAAGYDLLASVYDSAPLGYSGPVSFKRQLLKNYFLTPCVVAKKESLLQVGCFDESMRHAEDYYLWLKLCYRRNAFVLDTPGAYSIIGKRPFGESGLSSNLKAMHRGVQRCYYHLNRDGMITRSTYISLYGLEKIKYFRRLWLAK